MDSSSSPLENLQPIEKPITSMVVDMEAYNGDSQKPDPTRPANALSKLVESDIESERDDVPAPKPRGNLLSRLQVQKFGDSSESEEEEDDGDAYERVRKMLMAGSNQIEEPNSATKPIHRVEATSSDDEEDMPTRANNVRKLAPRKEPRSSPRHSRSPSLRSRRSSPGLFVNSDDSDVSPIVRRVHKPALAADDSDDSTAPPKNTELEDRVQRIRAERLANQRQKQEQARKKKSRQNDKGDSDSDPDGENGRRLTQSTRPTRKAGKKALEDMAREQQRISRNMQLTHQSKTKKKYGMKDLLSRFGLDQVDSEIVVAPTPDASSVLASSDAEGNQTHDTPPTSPPSQEDDIEKGTYMSEVQNQSTKEETVLNLSPSLDSDTPKTNKGKGRAPEFEHLPQNPLVQQSQSITVNSARESRTPTTSTIVELSDSDEDMNVSKTKSRFPVFDRLPRKQQGEAPSLLHLRHLAHLTSPGKKGPKGKQSMNNTELQYSLINKARMQAQKERDEKIEDLRRRGIHIETEEERAKLQMEIEDMAAQFEKARQEDLKLAKFERAEAKKNGKTSDILLSSDESDDDFVGSDAEDADGAELEQEEEEDADIELSGSEDEEMDDDDDADEADGLVDDAAKEDDDGEEQEELSQDELANEDDLEDEAINAPSRKRTVNRARNIVVDDEDESADEAPRKLISTQRSTQPSQTQDGDVAAFGFNNAGPTLGLTQMFAGTMADLNSESQNAHTLDNEPEQNSLDFLRSLPDTQPSNLFEEDSDMLVPNSQAAASQNESQPTPARRMTLGITQLLETSPAFTHTQASETFEPTQDAGFELSRSPAGLVPPPSTIDTIVMPVAESPIMKKKGKLHQRKEMVNNELSDIEDVDTAGTADERAQSQSENAFAALAKAAKKLKKKEDNFNKKTSWARDAIEEQAEESEDEYAGIGGGSDEDSGEEDEELAQMIDSNDIKVDERKLAAFYAEKSKKQDEKDINQIYKDIMNGGFRKRRGGEGFEMSDEEDEIEQRRRKKQMQFKQQTKALMADERLAQIGHNPKKAAFFQTLADHLEDPDYDFLDAPGMDANQEPSQSQSDENNDESQNNTEITVPDSQILDTPAAAPVNPLKRKSPNSQDSQKENRPPAHKRRTAATDNMIARKPMTLADVQHSVSELLEDPHIMVPDSQLSDSDSELEIEPPTKHASRNPIIDRLTLSRQNSALSETADSANDGMAFHASVNGAYQPGFRIPSLVRRATSNFSTVSTGSSGASTPSETSVRRGGTGRSNIHAQAREAERRAAVEKVELKRKESLKKKVAAKRGKRSVLGSLDQGFE